VPTSIEERPPNAVAFIKALALTQVDVLGFSSAVWWRRRFRSRRRSSSAVWCSWVPGHGGEGMGNHWTPEAQAVFGTKYGIRTMCALPDSSRFESEPSGGAWNY